MTSSRVLRANRRHGDRGPPPGGGGEEQRRLADGEPATDGADEQVGGHRHEGRDGRDRPQLVGLQGPHRVDRQQAEATLGAGELADEGAEEGGRRGDLEAGEEVRHAGPGPDRR